MTQHFLLTGASGFVGQALSRALLERGDVVTALVRRPNSTVAGVAECAIAGNDFDDVATKPQQVLRCDAVVHLAARVHMMDETASDPLAVYRAANVTGALRVARAAREAGARRFVFVSSVKAVAEASHGCPIDERTPPEPGDPYGVSKLEAERELAKFGAAAGMEIVIVRPPLVYGPNVRANFLKLIQALARGVPMPLGAIRARRSLVYVENLADALVHCATDARAAGETFNVTDGLDLPVSELARALARHLQAPARLPYVPPALLRAAGWATGRSAQINRLIGELRLNSNRIAEVLDWSPPWTVEQGLFETAKWFRSTYGQRC